MLSLLLSSCASNGLFIKELNPIATDENVLLPTDKPIKITFLIGDAGYLDEPENNINHVVQAAANHPDIKKDVTDVVYLGDNIYPAGLPKKDDPDRTEKENILKGQIEPLLDIPGDIYFIPGNHDWNKHKLGGRKAIIRQEKFIQNTYDNQKNNIKFYPNDACGDPKVIKINKDFVYVFIDSQWWLQDWDGEDHINKGCKVDSREELLVRLDDIIAKHKNDHILFMLHHPLKSNGNHGGYYSRNQHLFPLAEKGIWLPIPLIGSAYPLYRQLVGSKQDISHPLNNDLVSSLEKMAILHKANVTFASGHEHSLQFFDNDRIKYIVSGSGSEVSYLRKGAEATYTHDARGYAVMYTYAGGETWLEFYSLSPDNDWEPSLDYRTKIRDAKKGSEDVQTYYPDVVSKDTTFISNPEFKGSALRRVLLGKQYRDSWSSNFSVPIIDISNTHGGLSPIKIGGGMSSHSLRMENDEGRQYILRSMNKVYHRGLPKRYQELKILEIVRDFNTSIYPFSALTLPYLSQAANIYYTTPRLVYFKRQKALGAYADYIPEGLYSLEERPSGDWSDHAAFGYAKDIIGHADMIKNIKEKKTHKVDQNWTLRSRLFDILIHDWDRHEDQWRWAVFEQNDETVYRPIPRDRDFAYFRFDGMLPSIASQFALKNLRSMSDDLDDIIRSSLNAKNFDRSFLNELEWSEWQSEINYLQQNILPSVIDSAFTIIPNQDGVNYPSEIKSALKSRIKALQKAGKKYYKFLAKEVEIVGTNDADIFSITIHNDNELTVTHTISDKDGDVMRYQRKFHSKDTEEIRIYGLNKKDEFNIKGAAKNKIKINVIGGEGNDDVNNKSLTKIHVYDQTGGISMLGMTGDHTEDHYLVNRYDRYGNRYDRGFPLLTFGRTRDDGWWIGGGYQWTTYGWRKFPYLSSQRVMASIAPGKRDAYQINYRGIFPNLLSDKVHFNPTIDVSFPRYESYFGLGNESNNSNRSVEYNWVRLQSIDVSPMMSIGTPEKTTLSFGPRYTSQKIITVDDRIGEDEVLGFSENEKERKNYLGLSAAFVAQYNDNPVSPTSGFRLDMAFSYDVNPWDNESIWNFNTSFSTVFQLHARPEIILAHRIGYIQSGGDLQFHQYADLGNNRNLRGYRNERFRGEKAFYHNIDVRTTIKDWNNVWLPVKIGAVTSFDYGRVWLDEEMSDRWHASASLGLSFNFFGTVVLHPYYSFVMREEPNEISLRLGYYF